MGQPEIIGPWMGLITVIGDDGIERALEWVGAYSSAVYRAEKLTASGQYKGARAWACIGNFGACQTEKPPVVIEDGDQEPPAVTLDKWGI